MGVGNWVYDGTANGLEIIVALKKKRAQKRTKTNIFARLSVSLLSLAFLSLLSPFSLLSLSLGEIRAKNPSRDAY